MGPTSCEEESDCDAPGLALPILVVLAHRHLWAKLASQLATSMRIVILARTASYLR